MGSHFDEGKIVRSGDGKFAEKPHEEASPDILASTNITRREYGDIIQYVDEEGHYHREDGPAIEQPGFGRWWMRNNELDREDGPAIEMEDGHQYYYRHGKKHNENGPAVINPDGSVEHWINGERTK